MGAGTERLSQNKKRLIRAGRGGTGRVGTGGVKECTCKRFQAHGMGQGGGDLFVAGTAAAINCSGRYSIGMFVWSKDNERAFFTTRIMDEKAQGGSGGSALALSRTTLYSPSRPPASTLSPAFSPSPSSSLVKIAFRCLPQFFYLRISSTVRAASAGLP